MLRQYEDDRTFLDASYDMTLIMTVSKALFEAQTQPPAFTGPVSNERHWQGIKSCVTQLVRRLSHIGST